MTPKERAALAALDYVRSDSVIGLGSGTTSELFLQALGQALREGKFRNIRGVPTSNRVQQLAQQLRIPTTDIATVGQLDVTIDGADEVTDNLDLIKGLGGALLREKIVAQNSRQLVIMIDASKRVDVLGTKGPLPVEVTQFSHQSQERFLRSLGAVPGLRTTDNGESYVTDNGNYIYHCKFNGISDPQVLDLALSRRAGILESGLFLGMASVVLVGDDNGVKTLRRQ